MEPSKKSNNGEQAAHGGAAARRPNSMPARLASFAIARGQTGALRRHLAAGLDPDSMFHDDFSGPGPCALIEMAARLGQLECFRALENAGARITSNSIVIAVDHPLDNGVLAHLLESGKFDPRGFMESGCSWSNYANLCSPEAAPILAQAISALEQAELDSTTARSTSTRARRSL